MTKGTHTEEADFERLVDLAKQGRKEALEEIVRSVQGRIYNLALRALFLPADAEDATQEILIKVITHLAASSGKAGLLPGCFALPPTICSPHARAGLRNGDFLSKKPKRGLRQHFPC